MKHYYSIILFLSLFGKAQQMVCFDTIYYASETYLTGIKTDNNGNLFVTGRFGAYYNHIHEGFFIHKYSPAGNLLWIDTVITSFSPNGSGLTVDNSGNVYNCVWVGTNNGTLKIGGTIYPHGMYIIKYNPSGQIQWVINKPQVAIPYDMATDNLGFIYVTGNGAGADFISKYDTSGVCLSNMAIPATGDLDIDALNNIYVANIQAYDAAGNSLWTYPAGIGPKMSADKNGNCYLTDLGTQANSHVTKVLANGQVAWSIPAPYEGGYAILANEQSVWVGGFYALPTVCGVQFFKYNPSGITTWSYTIPSSNHLVPKDIAYHNGTLYAAINNDQAFYAYLFRLTEPQVVTAIDENKTENLITVFPNPSSSSFLITIKKFNREEVTLNVMDALGKIVFVKKIKQFGDELNETIDLSGCAKGIYFLEVSGKNYKETRKLVVE